MRIQSSYKGRIEKLIMVNDGDESVPNLLVELLGKMPFIEMVVLSHDKHREEELKLTVSAHISEEGKKRCIFLCPSSGKANWSVFVRDIFLAFHDSNGWNLLETRNDVLLNMSFKSSKRVEAPDHPALISLLHENLITNGNINPRSVMEKFIIEGGNILVGDEHILVGGNQFLRLVNEGNCIEQGHECIDLAVRKLNQVLQGSEIGGKKLLLIGFDHKTGKIGHWPQEQEHIDGFINLTGVIHRDSGKQYIIVAEPQNEDGTVHSHKETNYYSPIVDSLKPYFEVIRIPTPILPINGGETWLSYNNCIIENYDNNRTVYVPLYSKYFNRQQYLKTCEGKVREVWENCLGYNIVWIETDISSRIFDEGGLHCITNELRTKT